MVANELSRGTRVTVLAVAPESDRAALRRIFGRSRWILVEGSTLAEAEVLLRRYVAAVLICEAVLPDGTWIEVLRHAQSLPKPAPLIVMDRHADENLWIQVLNRGGYNLLTKPFSQTEVFEMVSAAWRHRKDRVQARAAG